MAIRIVVGVLLSSVFLQLTGGSFHLEFQISQYSNPSGSLANGLCCEAIIWLCTGSCDTAFEKICLGPGGSSDNCPWSEHVLSPGFVGGDSIQFTDTIGSVSNPFSFTVEQMGPFQLYVKVIDEDLTSSSDLIDEVKVQVPATKGVVTSQTFTGTFGTVSLVLSYSLTCTQNYYGSDCTTYCVPSNNSMGHYNCDPSNGTKICLPGYQNPENDCTEVACALVCTGGGGSCSESGVCECSQGWSGVDCGTAQCAENCHPEGGYCNVPGECLCNNNWSGTNCDQFLCHPNCSTVGGTCEIAGECVCLSGYTGEYCETDFNPCAHLSPCKNGGNCSNEGANQYSCACPFGLTGMDCEQEIDECNASPCANGATCIDEIGDYECLCVLGWTGVNCEDNIDECFSEPCQQGGNCTDLVDGYYCSCPVEYEGLNCELLLNACIPDPCQNGGSCNNFITDYACDCLPGFTGKNCATLLTTTHAMDFTPSSSISSSALLTTTNAMGFTPSSSITSSDTEATPVIVGSVIAILVAVIAVVVAFVILAGAMLRMRKKKQKFSLVSQSISHFDSTSGEQFSIGHQQLQSKADSHHENHPSVTKMTPNQAYGAHIFGSGDHQLPQDKADSQQQQHLEDTKMTPNLAYDISRFGFDGQQQLPQDEPSYEQVAVHSARNVTYWKSHLPAQQNDITDPEITSNPAYGAIHQQGHTTDHNEKMPKP